MFSVARHAWNRALAPAPSRAPSLKAFGPANQLRRFPAPSPTRFSLSSSVRFNGAFPGGQNLLFQGLWTDPVTGMGYARNRWYDARNAVFLTEDPLDDVDSPNVYGFVAGRPHEFTDPEGLLSEKNIAGAAVKTLARNVAIIGGIGIVTGLCPPCGAALAVAATGYLAYGVQSDINQRLKQGQNGAQATAGAVGNTTGIGGIAEGITNKDFATGANPRLFPRVTDACNGSRATTSARLVLRRRALAQAP